jgi:hypothetical protein
MLTTTFLLRDQYSEYGSWLKSQDPQTLHNYFGHSMNAKSIIFLADEDVDGDEIKGEILFLKFMSKE